MLSVILAKNLGMLAFQIRKLQKYWGLVLLWLNEKYNRFLVFKMDCSNNKEITAH